MIQKYEQISFSKMTLNRFILFVVLFSALIAPGAALAEIDEATLNHAIDRAGLQRMLTQRMLKSYCQLGLDQFYIKPDEKLADALKRYEEGLVFLKDFESVAGVNNSLTKINSIWPKYKLLITKKAIKDNAPVTQQIKKFNTLT